MDDKRYAVLIDSDNISSKYISNILDGEFNYTNTAVSQHSRQECY